MTSLHSQGDITIFGALQWKQEFLNASSVTISAGETIPLTNGMKFKSSCDWTWDAETSFRDVIVAVTVPSDQDFNLIPEIWIHREATNLELIYVESAGTRYQSLVNGINSYADHWKTLTSAERHALIYGIAAGVSAGFTAVDAAGTIIDFCATGGIGGLLWGAGKAIIGTAVTCNLASNHYQQVMLAQKAARSTETALVHMQNFAYELGISSNKVIYTPEIKSYTDLLCNFYSSTPFNGGHNFARPTTLPNMIIGAQHLPGYQAA